MAEQQVPQYYRKAFQDFSGALNDFKSPLMLKANEFADLENCVVNSTGLIDKMRGSILDAAAFTSDTTHFARLLVNYRRGTTVDKLIVAACDTANTNATYKVDLKETSGDSAYAYIGHTAGTSASFTNGNAAVTGVGTTWLSHLKAGDKIKATSHSDTVYGEIQSVNTDTSITLTAVYAGATATGVAYKARIILHKDYIPSAKVFNNNLIITNGSEKPMNYNNSTLNLLTDADAPRGRFIEIHKSRVFMAATPSALSAVHWSAVNDETSWDAAGFELVFPQDNGSIVAIKSFADSLIVFKDNGNIYQVVGSFDQDAVGEPDFIRKIDTTENIGIVAGRTCVVHDDGNLYFMTETGIYRLDRRMGVEKVSWNIENTLKTVNFQLGPANSKSYLYDTKAQWETGTLASGLRSSTDGTISPYFDVFTYSDALKGYNTASVFTDTSGKTHILYITLSDTLKYKRIGTDNTVEIERTVPIGSGTSLTCCSLAVSSSNVAGIACGLTNTSTTRVLRYLSHSSYSTGTVTLTQGSTAVTGSGTSWLANVTAGDYIKLSSSGTFYEVLTVNSDTSITLTTSYAETTASGASYRTSAFTSTTDIAGSATVAARAVSVAFSSTDPRLCYIFSEEDGTGSLTFRRYSSGAWQTAVVIQSAAGSGSYVHKRCSMDLNASNNPRISATFSTSLLRFYLSDNDGATWSEPDSSIAVTLSTKDNIQLDINASGQAITGFSDSGVFKTRNHATAVTATVDSTANTVLMGFQTSSGNNYAYTVAGASPNQVEKYRFAGSSTFSNATENVIDISGYRCGDRQMSFSSNVFSTASYGANANELVVRRLAFSTTWTGPETSDSTLSAWGTYVIGSNNPNGSTILHEIAVNTASPATVFTTITDGQTISTNIANVYVIPRITFTLGSFAAPSVGSVALNYTGAGVDARQAVAVVFDNQIYFAVTTDSGSANNLVLVYDKNGAWTTSTYAVSAVARYKNRLWAGNSVNGQVIRLLTGFNMLGVAYTATATTKEDLLGSLELTKDVYKAYVIYKVKDAGTFTFSYRVDDFIDADEGTWTSTTIDQTGNGLAEVDINQSCKSIQFRAQSSGLDTDMSIIGFVVLYGYLHVR